MTGSMDIFAAKVATVAGRVLMCIATLAHQRYVDGVRWLSVNAEFLVVFQHLTELDKNLSLVSMMRFKHISLISFTSTKKFLRFVHLFIAISFQIHIKKLK